MTANEYKERGYEVSSYIEQATIDRAEADVMMAYIEPIVGTHTDTKVAMDAKANLTFLLLLQRTLHATRAGAKVKTTAQSNEATAWDKVQQEAASCHLKLEALRKSEGAIANARIEDICKIYFNTNYLNL